MKRSILAALVVVALGTLVMSPDDALANPAAGRLEVLELQSEIFSNTRKIRVWLPPGYGETDDSQQSYPVLYMNDGQDLFDASSSLYFASEWGFDETLPALIGNGAITPIIVVGIDHGGREGRAREYLPYADEFLEPPEPFPMGSRYPAFLEQEVLSFVEGRYRVRDTKSGRTIGGSSYGGLIALYVVTTRPGLFGQLLVESPSLYVDDRHVLRDARRTEIGIERAYLGVGTNEIGLEDCATDPANEAAVNDVKTLSRLLIDNGLGKQRILVAVEPCGTHSPTAWARRLPAALQFLYGH